MPVHSYTCSACISLSLIEVPRNVLSDICGIEFNLAYRSCQPRPAGNVLSLEPRGPALFCQLSILNLPKVLQLR